MPVVPSAHQELHDSGEAAREINAKGALRAHLQLVLTQTS